MIRILKNRNFYLMFACDVVLVCLSLYLAYAVRFEFKVSSREITALLQILPYVLAIKLGSFFLFHMYQGMWRYLSLVDMLNAIKAATIASLLIITTVLLLNRFQGYSRSVFFIDWGLTLILVGGLRVGIRLRFAGVAGVNMLLSGLRMHHNCKRLLIIGAGDSGEKVVREILGKTEMNLMPIGFLDDDPGKQDRTIHGISILGDMDDLDDLAHLFDEILLAIPSANASKMRRIVRACERTGKPFRTLPALSELIDGKISLKAMRNVTLQDLFGREEVSLSSEAISEYLQHKRVLITGSGGSIGSELVRQVCRFYPGHLFLVEMNEYNLFQIEQECRRRFPHVNCTAMLVDIRDREALDHVFQDFEPQVVFHAAAYKHVPLQELNPWETVKNNVLGTKNILYAAKEVKVDRFVLVSTDKAVHPTNVMGATKRIAEMLVLCANDSTPSRFMAVRFGNVIGSSGSVIPTFQTQIERGGPVTVTHPEVTRYFMSIPEASQLILEAAAMGNGGETFILDMGKPVKIVDLARDLIRLHGYEPDRDIAIEFVGLRPGEKLYEELITQGEGIVETSHEKILVLRGDCSHSDKLSLQVEELISVAHSYDPRLIKQKIQEIVPEYIPDLDPTGTSPILLT
ncbi:MAG: polysaccharide biosynthesis protein [bacterium]|nr:polysaccharide biosynthesis protein [bacterium]